MTTSSVGYSSTTDTTAITITLASLPTSSTMVAGRESTVVDNTTNKYLDYLVRGQITTGTSPTTGKTVAVYVYAPLKVASSTATYPKAGSTALTGADAAATFDAEQRSGALIFAGAASINSTSDRAYSFAFSIASLFGGFVPLKWGLWVTHDTGQNLNATAGNHWFHWTGINATSA